MLQWFYVAVSRLFLLNHPKYHIVTWKKASVLKWWFPKAVISACFKRWFTIVSRVLVPMEKPFQVINGDFWVPFFYKFLQEISLNSGFNHSWAYPFPALSIGRQLAHCCLLAIFSVRSHFPQHFCYKFPEPEASFCGWCFCSYLTSLSIFIFIHSPSAPMLRVNQNFKPHRFPFMFSQDFPAKDFLIFFLMFSLSHSSNLKKAFNWALSFFLVISFVIFFSLLINSS